VLFRCSSITQVVLAASNPARLCVAKAVARGVRPRPAERWSREVRWRPRPCRGTWWPSRVPASPSSQQAVGQPGWRQSGPPPWQPAYLPTARDRWVVDPVASAAPGDAPPELRRRAVRSADHHGRAWSTRCNQPRRGALRIGNSPHMHGWATLTPLGRSPPVDARRPPRQPIYKRLSSITEEEHDGHV
jgi:hypothetical protein